MAIGNPIMNQLRGNVGGMRYSVRKGKQVVVARSATVQKANTFAQVAQKLKLAPLVNFYRAATDNFFEFAFSNKENAQTDYNAFVSRNMNLSPFLTKDENEVWPAFPAPYLVADGNLPINVVFQDFVENLPSEMLFSVVSDFAYTYKVEEGGDMAAGCFMPLDDAPADDTTWNVGLVSYLLKSELNVQDGDKVTFLSVVPYTTSQVINGIQRILYACAWDFASVIINEDDRTPILKVQTLAPAVGKLCVGTLPAENGNFVCVGVKSSALGANGRPLDGGGLCAVIVTRDTPNGIAANRAVLRFRTDEYISAPSSGALYEEKRSEAALLAAAASYGFVDAPLDPATGKQNVS